MFNTNICSITPVYAETRGSPAIIRGIQGRMRGVVAPIPQKTYCEGKLIILNGSVNCDQLLPSLPNNQNKVPPMAAVIVKFDESVGSTTVAWTKCFILRLVLLRYINKSVSDRKLCSSILFKTFVVSNTFGKSIKTLLYYYYLFKYSSLWSVEKQ